MPEQSEGNNHMSKINVFSILHTIFFYWGVAKWICLPHREQQNALYDLLVEKIYFADFYHHEIQFYGLRGRC